MTVKEKIERLKKWIHDRSIYVEAWFQQRYIRHKLKEEFSKEHFTKHNLTLYQANAEKFGFVDESDPFIFKPVELGNDYTCIVLNPKKEFDDSRKTMKIEIRFVNTSNLIYMEIDQMDLNLDVHRYHTRLLLQFDKQIAIDNLVNTPLSYAHKELVSSVIKALRATFLYSINNMKRWKL